MHTHALSKIYPAINATTRRQKLRSSEKDENVQVAHSVGKKNMLYVIHVLAANGTLNMRPTGFLPKHAWHTIKFDTAFRGMRN